MTRRLEGQVALVTGGAQGIGLAIAEAFAAEGATVGVLDRQVEKAQQVAARIESGGGRAMAFGGDVAQRESFTTAVGALRQAYGRFDVLVNNAIWVRYGPISAITPDMLSRMLGTGLSSVVWGIQVGAEAMEAGGSIVNIASSAAFLGLPDGMLYCGVKAGVLGLSRSAATDLGPLGIRVNSICPGSIVTEGVKINVDEQKAAVRIAKTPMKRLGTVEDIARAAVFLASSDSSFITGESLLVDGGVTHAFL